MNNDWEHDLPSLSKINVLSHPENLLVTIENDSGELKFVGRGTDAAVFQSVKNPQFAYKLYAKDEQNKAKIEAEVYKKLGDSPFFPTLYAAYDTHLVLSYEHGKTLYDCIIEGIHIPHQVIDDVENAIAYARNQGLNPRDIHLKNIFLQNGRAKIIDVSEYMRPGDDYRWSHLKKGYDEYYHLIDSNSVPLWLVTTIQKWYKQRGVSSSSFEEFSNVFLKLFNK